MTAAVAGRVAAGAATGGGRAAAGGAAARSSRAATRAGNRPRPNVDEREAAAAQRTRDRGDRAAGDFRKRYADGKRAEKPAAKPAADESDASTDRPSTTRPTSSTVVSMPGPVSSGAGFILGVLFWAWIALPFLKDGPAGVTATLRAKFTNKAPDGSWLP